MTKVLASPSASAPNFSCYVPSPELRTHRSCRTIPSRAAAPQASKGDQQNFRRYFLEQLSATAAALK